MPHLAIEVIFPESVIVILCAVERVADAMIKRVCEVVAAAAALTLPGVVSLLDGLKVSPGTLPFFHQSIEVALPKRITFFTATEGISDLIVVLLYAEVKALMLLVTPFPLGIFQPPLIKLAQLGMERYSTGKEYRKCYNRCRRITVHKELLV